MKEVVKVSGVPYSVEMLSSEEEIKALRAENKALRERIKALIEECCWLEAKTREIKQSTQGEH